MMKEQDKSPDPTFSKQSEGAMLRTTKDVQATRVSEWLQTRKDQRKPQIEVSFSRLNCYGVLNSAQYQATFLSAFASLLQRLRRRQQSVHILHDFEGLVRPGEMLLVLGRPGSGCSSFLKTLAGETHGFKLDAASECRYRFSHGGTGPVNESKASHLPTSIPYHQMHRKFTGERIYLAELDVHFPELGLGQTLEFAASTRRRATNVSSAAGSTPPSSNQIIASMFDLNEALDTRIGDSVTRGISGGEKRRTSIAEAYVGGAQLQCWDNSTRGLDSSTAKRFIELLRISTDETKATVAMSLYQASESMYKCFDKVMLLYEGREIFFGPVDLATEYFVAMGFARPSRATTPDFLTSLTNPAERVVRAGYHNRIPRTPDEFALAWEQSEMARLLHDEVKASNSTERSLHSQQLRTDGDSGTISELSFRDSTFPLQIHEQVLICVKRAYQRLCNDYVPILSNLIANSVLGIILGSVFYNLSESTNDLRQRSILLFFVTMLNSFVPAFEVDLMWAQRPIVEKQHRYAFYHPFVERLASMVCDFPSKLALSFMLHIPVYFMTNLRRTASAFFTYWCFMLANLMTMAMLFRMIGTISKSRNGTMTPVSILTVLCVLYAGYVVPPSYMVPWLGWFRFINPVAYTYESLMINEFSGRRFPCHNTIPNGPEYASISPALKLCPEIGRIADSDNVDGTRHIELKYGYTEDHLWRNIGILVAMMVVFCVIHLLAAEYIPAEMSRGEVLFFKHGVAREARNKQITRDEETGKVSNFAQDAAILGLLGEGTSSRSSGATTSSPKNKHASTFHWSGVTYGVKTGSKSRTILNGVEGWLKPGSFTVLMGATGAGKTTLLDVLADQTSTGIVGGEVFIDHQSRERTGNFRRRMGYVQQNDIHLQTSTVREALQFSSLLRQSTTRSQEDKLAHVEKVLEMLDMEAYADAIVGVVGEGLNVEQRRRLSIAIELVAMPDLVLFLDEPTSGLDSQTAWSICTLLRKLVNNNYTILCTIHQPSAQLFNMFDRVLLLQEGSTVYFGDIGQDAHVLTTYFESKGAQNCLPDQNPAEWMLDITRSQANGSCDDESWSTKWHSSQERQNVLKHLESLETEQTQSELPINKIEPGHDQGGFAAPLSKQIYLVSKRFFQDQWRDPVYLYTKTAMCIGLSLVNGISFYNAKHDIQGLTNLLFSIFLVSQLFSALSLLIIPRFVRGRDIFETRERNSKTYSWVAFVTANILVEATWLILISVCLFVCWYYPTGMQRNASPTFGTTERGGLVFFLIWLFCLWTSTLSQAFAAAISGPETAIQIATLCFWLSLVFCGILVPPTALPGFWIFMYHLSPLTYVLEGLAIAGISDTRVVCSVIEMLPIVLPPDEATCGEYLRPYLRAAGGYLSNEDDSSGNCQYCPLSDANLVLQSLGMGSNRQRVWRNVGVMAAFVVFNTIATFAIYWLARVPRKSRRRTGQ